MMRTRTGLERLLHENNSAIKKKKTGLLTNHTSVNDKLDHSVDLFIEQGYDIKKIFSPEHGFRGEQTAEESIENQKDKLTGLPVVSLFPLDRASFEADMQQLELLIFDIQDIGVRFYTYIDLLAEGMAAAEKAGIPIAVLDRPNPATGAKVQGNVKKAGVAASFTESGLPVRHGFTVGEIARYLNVTIKSDLTVYPMTNWKRNNWFDDTGLHWIQPSPNATGKTMCALYPGMSLLDGINVSNGIGTTRPFELAGAPWIAGHSLCHYLKEKKLQGVLFRPVNFKPFTSMYEGEVCEGVQLHVTDYQAFDPLKAVLSIYEGLWHLYPEKVKWKKKQAANYWIDELLGTDELRLKVSRGEHLSHWKETCDQEAQAFRSKYSHLLLY